MIIYKITNILNGKVYIGKTTKLLRQRIHEHKYSAFTQNRLYDCSRWRALRRNFLNANPLCAMCLKQGRDTIADTVDHIEPHKGNIELFYKRDNLQSLCSHCHNASKQMQELYGYSPACDVNGYPIDKNHPFSKKGK